MLMLWLKALHISFVICWFAGLFYLPRILVHHAASDDEGARARLVIMARKLYRFVTPMMWLAVLLGLATAFTNWDYYLLAPWMWLKVAGVLLLMAYHYLCGRYVRAIDEKGSPHGHVYFRFFNEIPVLFLFAIVLLVVLKPF